MMDEVGVLSEALPHLQRAESAAFYSRNDAIRRNVPFVASHRDDALF